MVTVGEHSALGLSDFISSELSEKLGLSEDDISEIVDDLSEWGIVTVEKFRLHLLLADRWREGIVDEASALYAQRHSLDPAQKYYHRLSDLDYTEYLLFFDLD